MTKLQHADAIRRLALFPDSLHPAEALALAFGRDINRGDRAHPCIGCGKTIQPLPQPRDTRLQPSRVLICEACSGGQIAA